MLHEWRLKWAGSGASKGEKGLFLRLRLPRNGSWAALDRQTRTEKDDRQKVRGLAGRLDADAGVTCNARDPSECLCCGVRVSCVVSPYSRGQVGEQFSLPQSDAFIPGEGRKGEERSENVGWKGRERDGGKLVGIVGVREIAFRSPRRRGREKLDNTRRDGPHPPTPPRSDGRGEKFGL